MAPAPHPLDPHHDGSVHHVRGTADLGAEVTLRVRVPHRADGSPGARRVVLRALREAAQQQGDETSLPALLAEGRFEASGERVVGRWQIEWGRLEKLLP